MMLAAIDRHEKLRFCKIYLYEKTVIKELINAYNILIDICFILLLQDCKTEVTIATLLVAVNIPYKSRQEISKLHCLQICCS